MRQGYRCSDLLNNIFWLKTETFLKNLQKISYQVFKHIKAIGSGENAFGGKVIKLQRRCFCISGTVEPKVP
jgi:hypothetical protein